MNSKPLYELCASRAVETQSSEWWLGAVEYAALGVNNQEKEVDFVTLSFEARRLWHEVLLLL